MTLSLNRSLIEWLSNPLLIVMEASRHNILRKRKSYRRIKKYKWDCGTNPTWGCQILRTLAWCENSYVRRMPMNPKEVAEKYENTEWTNTWCKSRNRQQEQLVAVLEDAFTTFQWIDRLQSKSWQPSTSPPSLTSPPSSPTQPTWCAPTFSM